MSTLRIARRFLRPWPIASRPLSSSPRFMAGPGNAQEHPNVEGHRKLQSEKPLNPHMTNTNSTVSNEMPSVGAQKAPPELITSIDPDFTPKDSVPENTDRMTGGTQKSSPDYGPNAELGVGEVEGVEFKVEPLKRTGEDANTMRARLLYQSRKRGTLESDLLLSTFADSHLPKMTKAQMAQYDEFLDENDWDVYYWATQQPPATSRETAEGAGESAQGANAQAKGEDQVSSSDHKEPQMETDAWRQGQPRSGEWAQTVGTFKPAYRPVPARWRNSEILSMLRRHVISRSAGGVQEEEVEASRSQTGQGMAFMPPVFRTDQSP